MRTRLPSALVIALCCAAGEAAAQDPASGINSYFTLANGYWSRGLSQNDGISVQAGLDYQLPSGWFAGAWAANVEFDREQVPEAARELALNLYGGYHRRGGAWSWTVTVGRYLYPDAGLDYDYTELNGTVGFRDRVFYTVSYGDDFYGLERSSLNQELSVAFPLAGDVEIGATVGRFAMSSSGPAYTHWNVGVSKVVRRIALDLRYYDHDYRRASWLGNSYDDQYVLSVSYALRLRKTRI